MQFLAEESISTITSPAIDSRRNPAAVRSITNPLPYSTPNQHPAAKNSEIWPAVEDGRGRQNNRAISTGPRTQSTSVLKIDLLPLPPRPSMPLPVVAICQTSEFRCRPAAFTLHRRKRFRDRCPPHRRSLVSRAPEQHFELVIVSRILVYGHNLLVSDAAIHHFEHSDWSRLKQA